MLKKSYLSLRLLSTLGLVLLLLVGSAPAQQPSSGSVQASHLSYVECPACRGAGEKTCSHCNGVDLTKQVCNHCWGADLTKQTCPHCNGLDLTKLTCQHCDGVDLTKLTCQYCNGRDLTKQTCPSCDGSGSGAYGNCFYCSGSGKARACFYCSGSGKQKTCFYCKGSGHQSVCFYCKGGGHKSTCFYCKGSGHKSACFYCKGYSGQSCNLCSGNGRVLAQVVEKQRKVFTTPIVAENGSYYGEPNDNGVPKTVFVQGYYRKDGTYVRSHFRSPPYSNPQYTYDKSVGLRGPGIAENGSYYGEISKTTGRPKTVYVKGYYRKDGTYVRGHYRSKKR